MKYQEVLDYLYNSLPMYHRIGSAAYKEDIVNTIAMMDILDYPERKFKSIHVAGTNGKGSVSHFLASILQNSGYKVGLYTSPHLVDFRERIRINGNMIPKEYVVQFVESHKMAFETIRLSFFEMTVAMAFDYFANENVDIAIIEVGMGGRLDSTNIITPLLSVITNIGMDHTQFLGNTLEAIAREKAGIIKQNVPIVIGETQAETQAVFTQKAKEMCAPLYYADKNYSTKDVETFQNYLVASIFKGDDFYASVKSPLSGLYQLKNIITVTQAVDVLVKLGFPITIETFKVGIESVVIDTGLRGRWEILSQDPLIICETAHNEDGIRYLVEKIKTLNYKTLHIIYGCVNDKDYTKILSLLPTDAHYYFCKPSVQRGLEAKLLMNKAKAFHLQGNVYPTIHEAIYVAKQTTTNADLIVITGSIFLVADAMDLYETKNYV